MTLTRPLATTAAVLLLAFLLPAATAGQGEQPSETELGWLESFLMTSEERRASIRAVSLGDRGAFRRLFWMRRDPTPDTPQNETLDRYLARVRLAETNFRGDGYGGGGDRARVFVLLGLPVQTVPRPATEETPEALFWVYPPDAEAGIGNGIEAYYLRDPDGRLWLENRREVDDELESLRESLIVRPEIGFERGPDGRLRIPNLPAGGSEGARRVLERMAAEAGEPGAAAGFPFRVTPSFFREGDDATFVALLFEAAAGNLATAGDGQSAASVFAQDAGAAREGASTPGAGRFRFETAHTRIQPGGAPARFEASLVLPPGRRRLLLGLVDEQSEAFGTAVVEVEAPAFPAAEPSFSSVVLYGETATAETSETGEPPPDRAFQFGRTHFRLRADGVFRREETLGAFYFFYPGDREDDGELPEVVAEYAVLRDGQETGFVRPEPLPTSTRQAAANAEIPLAQFTPGRYRLRIRIRYRDETYETGADFTLRG